MKIAISVENDSLKSDIDLKFGRAKGFIIFNIDTNDYKFINNEINLNATQGAGIQAAQLVADEDVSAVITGYCGPKAYKVLEASGIKILTSEKDTIENVIEKFKNNDLAEQKRDF